MPHVRNFYYRSIKCPLCQKIIDMDDDTWFCSKKCKNEWEKINNGLKKTEKIKIKGQDTSG